MNTVIEKRRVPVSMLKPADYNPRKDLKPGDEEYEKLKASVAAYGYVEPIVWNEVTGNIVGGHQRLKVLIADGATEVEVSVVHIEKDADEKSMNIALNAARGEWEPTALADLLDDLQNDGYDLTLTGYTAPEVDDLMSQVYDKELASADFSQPVTESKSLAKSGDLWEFGRHRLLCMKPGAQALATLMDGQTASLLLTEPCEAVPLCAAVLKPGATVYLFHEDADSLLARQQWEDLGAHLSGVCIWIDGQQRKQSMHYSIAHRTVLYGWMPKGNHKWLSDRKQTTLWEGIGGTEPWPPTVMAYAIRTSAARNAIVLALTEKTGSAIIACEKSNRVCLALQSDPFIVDCIIQRYRDAAGTDRDVYVVRDGRRRHVSDIE